MSAFKIKITEIRENRRKQIIPSTHVCAKYNLVVENNSNCTQIKWHFALGSYSAVAGFEKQKSLRN